MKVLFYLLVVAATLLSISTMYAAQNESFVLSSAEWSVPRTSQSVIRMPAIQQAVSLYEEMPRAVIQLRYAGGDEGTLWASELRSWLVALGIASSDIELLPGATEPGQLELRVNGRPPNQPAN